MRSRELTWKTESKTIYLHSCCQVFAENVKIKRASKNAGEISHVKHVYDLFELKDPFTHQQGTYMPRTLKFMRTCYPKQKVDPIIMLCIGKIFATTHLETMQTLPPEFEDDLMQLLRSLGSAKRIQETASRSI